MGYYEGWSDEQLADIAIGNTAVQQAGLGITALRPSLPESFLEHWGYDIRAEAFRHYKSLGVTENTLIIGFPSEDHRDTTFYCNEKRSRLFANLYLDIWDDGEFGTPVNDLNYYALYIYNLAQFYGKYIRFWEVWNEPDFSFTVNSILESGQEGNWWEYEPAPCDYALHAPVFHYIRMLRITYEIVKKYCPDAYVAVGGLGYPSFLDVLLRNTDNPLDGSYTDKYPFGGGAWFDAMSYHTYPHIDGSMRSWSNEAAGFLYNRNSDSAAAGVINKKAEFQKVLNKYGYDGHSFPEKKWIITESNIPRKGIQYLFGNDEAQRNFTIKTLVECQKAGIHQFYVYQLGETANFEKAENEFEVMGLYQNLKESPPYQQIPNESGIAYKTTSDLLSAYKYDPEKTEALQLADGIKGGAFLNDDEEYIYVLWAKAVEDRSERIFRIYSFPESFNIGYAERKLWDFSITGKTSVVDASLIQLNGTPVFLKAMEEEPEDFELHEFECYPNPFSSRLNIVFHLFHQSTVSLSLLDQYGRIVHDFEKEKVLPKGTYHYELKNIVYPPGVYYLHLTTEDKLISCKVIHLDDY
ncbi:MAG: T9SS type A sorting domain-containing protein [Bacteroidetes bacterium]|nr:T9SS type A sorting domain-containing protein [Bacteroidota bacterium]